MRNILKNYFRILFITLAIQIVMVGVGYLVGIVSPPKYRMIINFALLGYIGSLIVDIYLAAKLDAPVYQKLICTFLMLSNYTPLTLFWLVLMMFGNFFEMLPKNLG